MGFGCVDGWMGDWLTLRVLFPLCPMDLLEVLWSKQMEQHAESGSSTVAPPPKKARPATAAKAEGSAKVEGSAAEEVTFSPF